MNSHEQYKSIVFDSQIKAKRSLESKPVQDFAESPDREAYFRLFDASIKHDFFDNSPKNLEEQK
jgi:hypothetical protein